MASNETTPTMKAETMYNKLRSIRNHVYNHRACYAAGATGAIALWFLMQCAEEWNEFLTEHGLLEEFYAFEEE